MRTAFLLSCGLIAACSQPPDVPVAVDATANAAFVYESQRRILYENNGKFSARRSGASESYSLGQISDCSDAEFHCVSGATFQFAVPHAISEGSYVLRDVSYTLHCVGQALTGECGSAIILYRYSAGSGLPYQQGFFSYEPATGIRIIGMVRADPTKPSDTAFGDVFILKRGAGLLASPM